MKLEAKLNIGDLLYTGSKFRTMSYKVYEIRQTADSIFYAVECQDCHHGPEKCKMLIAPLSPKQDKFIFVEMINNYEDDEDEGYEDQSMWHSDEIFFRNKWQGVIQRLEKIAREEQNAIDDLTNRLNNKQKDLEKTLQTLNEFKESMKDYIDKQTKK